MAVPGANRTRLGQGMPGGAAALPGSLPLPGGGTLGPPPGNLGAISVPGRARAQVGASTDAAPAYTGPTVVNHPQTAQAYQEVGGDKGMLGLRQKQDMQQNAGSTKNITVALGVLDQVRKGKLKPDKAAKLMQGLTAGDQARLADLVVGRNNREGKTNMNELKALQALQRLPAPSDVEPHDILSNFTRDVSGLVTGLPAGIGLAAAYGGRDVLNEVIPGRKPTSLFKDKILSPVGKNYAETYGPALHGDFGKTLHQFHEHPLGPVLDALSVFSAGAGTVGRLGKAGEAVSAARASAVAEARRGVEAGLDPTTEFNRHVGFTSGGMKSVRGLHKAWNDPEIQSAIHDPQFLKENPWALRMPVVVDKSSGEIFVGGPGFAHDDLHEFRSFDRDGKYIGTSDDLRIERRDKNLLEGTAIRDPDTGRVATVNFGEFQLNPGDTPGNLWGSGLGNHDRVGYGGADAEHLKQQAVEASNQALGYDKSVPSLDLTLGQKARVAVPAFLKGGGKGGLIDLYDRRRGITHETEIQETMKQVAEVLDDPDLQLSRRSFKGVVADVANDIRATREVGKARPAEMESDLPGFISARSTGRALSAGETTLREASDLVRAGAIYLRPAYLPNNWAGNGFMSVVHQGVLAPVNLAKSFALDKEVGIRYTRAMDKSMGDNPATVVTSGKGRGYVASLTQPVAHLMGKAADQPFRRAAWLHEARRAGYSKLSDVRNLFDKAAGGDQEALREIATIARKAQEEIVKFGHMNEAERSLIRNLVFVYSWMRGAGRFASRFPFQHPIQTDVFNAASGPGNDYTKSIMGGVPSFMAGVVPIGRGKDGNPIVINPFSLNPLGTGLQLMRAAAGTLDVLRDPKSFNKYAQDDVVGLLNPILGAYITAREGGPSMKKQLENTIAAMALVKGLKHPGSGSIYPTSRSEAVGHFTLGALYPREADAAAVKKSLERQNIGDPIALIPQQITDFQKATGKEPPYSLVIAYRKDLEDLQVQKDFQARYADSHGASGFRNMPPQNRLEAGIEFLRKYGKIKAETVDEIERTSKKLTTDGEYNEFANAVWNLTGVGQWKDAWSNMMRQVKGTALTRKRG